MKEKMELDKPDWEKMVTIKAYYLNGCKKPTYLYVMHTELADGTYFNKEYVSEKSWHSLLSDTQPED